MNAVCRGLSNILVWDFAIMGGERWRNRRSCNTRCPEKCTAFVLSIPSGISYAPYCDAHQMSFVSYGYLLIGYLWPGIRDSTCIKCLLPTLLWCERNVLNRKAAQPGFLCFRLGCNNVCWNVNRTYFELIFNQSTNPKTLGFRGELDLEEGSPLLVANKYSVPEVCNRKKESMKIIMDLCSLPQNDHLPCRVFPKSIGCAAKGP